MYLTYNFQEGYCKFPVRELKITTQQLLFFRIH